MGMNPLARFTLRADGHELAGPIGLEHRRGKGFLKETALRLAEAFRGGQDSLDCARRTPDAHYMPGKCHKAGGIPGEVLRRLFPSTRVDPFPQFCALKKGRKIRAS